MSSDVVMMVMAIAGIGLTLAYFYVAVSLWRQNARSAQQKEADLRKLHAERLRAGRAATSPVKSPASDRQIAA
jgi:hypothetical protein